MNPALKRRGAFLARFVWVWLACAFVSLVFWVPATFGEVSLGQILFHWRYLGGAETVATLTASDFLVQCVGQSLAAALLLSWIVTRVVRPWMQRRTDARHRRWFARLGWLVPCLTIVASVAVLAERTSALQALGLSGGGDYFSSHYVPPEGVKLTARQPKNLVLVYVESLESTYQRTDVFGRDLLAALTALHPFSFPAYEQLNGTGYTIAALVSTQCAVPLQMVGILDWQKQGERADAFLPGATCLSDLLAARGYHNVFMGGASLEFSGKGKFLLDHHYHEVFGRAEWTGLGIPKMRMSGWGLHDDDLFAQAKAKIRQLHQAGQPFDLTLLTVDSHWPSGHVSDGCRARGARELEGVIECTAAMTADLVRYLRETGFDADTNVVVIGDHLSPPNSLSAKVAQVQKRTIYNAWFSRTPPTPNRSTLVHFDLLPTLLEFIGLEVEGGREGLGFAAFGPPPEPFPNARSRAELSDNALSPSHAYLGLWSPVSGPAPSRPAATRPADPAPP